MGSLWEYQEAVDRLYKAAASGGDGKRRCRKCGGDIKKLKWVDPPASANPYRGDFLEAKCPHCGAPNRFPPNDAPKPPEPPDSKFGLTERGKLEDVHSWLRQLKRNKPRWFR